MAERTFFGTMRIAVLLAVLVFVALGAWLERRRSTDWDEPLRVTIYPVALQDDDRTRAYVAALSADDYAPIGDFLAEEAAAFGLALAQPVALRVSHAASRAPPLPPEHGSVPGIMAWSLKLRWWAWRIEANDSAPPPEVQMFALYHPAETDGALPHSTGLQKGLIAIAHLFASADMAGSNQVVLTHELLHTLGATDKYQLATGQPLVPHGLGDPERAPLFPQDFAEIMAGRIALSANEARIPTGLDETTLSSLTAREIGWLQ